MHSSKVVVLLLAVFIQYSMSFYLDCQNVSQSSEAVEYVTKSKKIRVCEFRENNSSKIQIDVNVDVGTALVIMYKTTKLPILPRELFDMVKNPIYCMLYDTSKKCQNTKIS
jgi:hypothetical protein